MIILSNFTPRLSVLNVERGRNLLCEIGPLNGDREEKNTPFSGKTLATPDDAVCLKTDPFRRFFWTRVRSKSYGEWPPPPRVYRVAQKECNDIDFNDILDRILYPIQQKSMVFNQEYRWNKGSKSLHSFWATPYIESNTYLLPTSLMIY